jgi:DNA-binding response OmpR family regulator
MAGGRVLIVDDDAAVCELISDMLEGSGLEPVCVQSDRDAYEVLLDPAELAALIADVNLGRGTTGFDIARRARSAAPDVAVIFVSGEAAPDSLKAFGVPGSVFLAKPFTADELLAKLEAQLS